MGTRKRARKALAGVAAAGASAGGVPRRPPTLLGLLVLVALAAVLTLPVPGTEAQLAREPTGILSVSLHNDLVSEDCGLRVAGLSFCTMTTPVKWPNGARCAIMMTFDLDGESPWIQRDPALADRYLHMSMGSYGPKTGMPRILDLLDHYDIKTCIFIPGWIVERYPALCEEIVRRGHEVGQHGYLHERPSSLKGREEEEALLVKSLDIFKKVLGVKPLGSRSPSADPSKHTMELLKKHGFVYHSNALDTDLPYCIETPLGPLVEFPTSWCNNDAPFFLFSSAPPVGNGIWSQQDVWEIWSEEFEGMYEEGGFYNWLGHPQIIGRPSRMRMVERLIQRMLGKKDVWWPKPIDLAKFWLEKSQGSTAQ